MNCDSSEHSEILSLDETLRVGAAKWLISFRGGYFPLLDCSWLF
jgi:hypothetical protein